MTIIVTMLFAYTRVASYRQKPGEMGRPVDDTCCLSHYHELQCS